VQGKVKMAAFTSTMVLVIPAWHHQLLVAQLVMVLKHDVGDGRGREGAAESGGRSSETTTVWEIDSVLKVAIII